MTREDIQKRIESLEEQKFLIWMTERWTEDDRQLLWEVEHELEVLRKEVE